MCNRPVAAAAAVLLLSGCAIHPVPEDVTGVDTSDIVRQIRCETREAAVQFLIRELGNLAAGGETQPPNPIAQKIVAAYEADHESISTFRPSMFAGPEYLQVRNFYNVIYTTGVAYNFDLTMSEDNNLTANANFLGPWNGAAFTLGLMGDANRQRANERTFTVTDTIGMLVTNLNAVPIRGVRFCDGQIKGPNYVYPIAGHIGVDKMVKTFFELAYFASLAPTEKGAPPTMADKLTFTTIVDLSLMPKVVFAPVKSGFQPTDATLNGLARRSDVHKVSVGLALDPKSAAALASLHQYLFSAERAAGISRSAAITGVTGAPMLRGQVYQGTTMTASVSTVAEQLAVIAVDQLKSREIQIVPGP
jgi:hypothetical protein